MKKTLTESHDYSRLFSQEKRRLKMGEETCFDFVFDVRCRLLFLKIAIEEKLFGPAVAAKNVKALAVHLTKLGFPAITFWYSELYH